MAIPTRNDLSASIRGKSIDLLSQALADLIDLSAQAKVAHWNVKGPHFIAYHELFDKTHEAIDEHVDTVAERIAALGGEVDGDVRSVAKRSRLAGFPRKLDAGLEFVDALSEAVALVTKHTRKAIDLADDAGDKVTADLFTEVARDLDQRLWFLEAHLRSKA
jgi:starvation-inducible DNA-binding protein